MATLKSLASDLQNINKELSKLASGTTTDPITLKFLEKMSGAIGTAISEAKTLENSLKELKAVAKESGNVPSTMVQSSSRMLEDIKRSIEQYQANLDKYLGKAIGGVKLGGAGAVEKLDVRKIADFTNSLKTMQENLAKDAESQKNLQVATTKTVEAINTETEAVKKNGDAKAKTYGLNRQVKTPAAPKSTPPLFDDEQYLKNLKESVGNPQQTLDITKRAIESLKFEKKQLTQELKKAQTPEQKSAIGSELETVKNNLKEVTSFYERLSTEINKATEQEKLFGEEVRKMQEAASSSASQVAQVDALIAGSPAIQKAIQDRRIKNDPNYLASGGIERRSRNTGNYISTGDDRVINPDQPNPQAFNQESAAAERLALSITNVQAALAKMGVEGLAAERIIAALTAQMSKLETPATGLVGSNINGSLKLRKFQTEPGVKVTSDQVGINEKFDAETGLTSEFLRDWRQAQSKAIREEQRAVKEFDRKAKQALEAREKEAREQARIAERLAFVENVKKDPTLNPILSQAQQRGFSAEDVKSVEQQGTAGTRLVSFARDDFSQGYKIVQKFNATITETGDVLPEVGRRFRTFGASVVRDIGELTKWSIAMAVIYGPIQKLGEITTLMISNEVKLASATVAVNNAFVSQVDIFNASAQAANAAGEEINTTIDAFTQAYRATGGGADETTRFATAQKLLSDSMTLAKLAGMDESTAIDTLSAALRQTGTDLDKGSSLLDKWVKTSQVANVDIGTLATGFAVMGDTAEAAGLNVDQLNALVATVAETGLASGKEAANSARRLVTAYETPGAKEALRQLGIATEDYTGKARGFLDISKEIYEMKKKGLISKDDFSNLTLVAGQGVRGQAALSAVLSNFDRYGQIMEASKSTQGGEAAKAMETQLTTAQTAINRFNNAFQSLAQTLGTKGGLLDAFKGITNGATLFIKALDLITSGTGKATPMIVAMTAALIAFYRKPAETRTMYGMSIEKGVTDFAYRALGGTPGSLEAQAGLDPRYTQAQRFGQFIGTGGASAGNLGKAGFGAGVGLATSAITAASNFASGDKEKAFADIGGGIAGGIVGSFVGGPMGAMVGSTIGTSMAEVFISLTRPEIDIWKIGNKQLTEISNNNGTDTKTGRAEELKNISDKIVSEVGKITTSIETYLSNKAIGELNAKITSGDTEGIKSFFDSIKGLNTEKVFQSQGIDLKSALERAKTGKTYGEISAGEAAFGVSANDSLKNQYLNLKTQAENAGDTGESLATKQKAAADKKYSAVIEQITSSAMQDLANQSKLGKIKPSDYASKTTMAANADTILQPIIAALGGELSPDKIKELFDVMTYGATEATQPITTLAENILTLTDAIASATDPAKKKELQDQMDILKGSLQSQVEQQSVQVSLARTPQAQIQGDVSNPFTQSAVTSIINQTKNLQRGYYRSEAGGNLSERQISALEATFEKAAFPIQQGAQLFYETVEGLDPKFIPIAEKFLEAAGMQLQAAQQKNVDFQQFKDVDRGTLERAAQQSIALNNQWKQKFGYTGTTEQQIAIAKDGVAKPLKADFKILAMLLEKLVDQGQKQLDGMFNMPEGSSFWVNLAAAKMDRETRAAQNTGGGKGFGITTGEGPYIGTQPLANMTPKAIDNTSYLTSLLTSPTLRSKSLSDTAEQQRAKELNSFYSNMLSNPALGPRTPTSDRRDLIGDSRSGGAPLSKDSFLDKIQQPLKDAMKGTTPIKLDNTITQNLNVRFTSNTTLTLDGRILASIVKQYMASDMSKATSTNSTSSAYFAV
jgi:TP901 family phage tail tape measure protein